MKTKVKNTSVSRFAEVVVGQKEVGLAIAKNEAELSLMQKKLKNDGFCKVETVSDILNPPKSFLLSKKLWIKIFTMLWCNTQAVKSKFLISKLCVSRFFCQIMIIRPLFVLLK